MISSKAELEKNYGRYSSDSIRVFDGSTEYRFLLSNVPSASLDGYELAEAINAEPEVRITVRGDGCICSLEDVNETCFPSRISTESRSHRP